MRLFMKLVSGFCHPLLMASYISLILFFGAPELFTYSTETFRILLIAVFLTTCFIPALGIYLLKIFSKISNLEITDRQERPLPFMSILIWYGFACYLFVWKLQVGSPFSTIILTVSILIGLLLIITKWFKISIHSTAIWGGIGILSALAISRGIMIDSILLSAIILGGLTNSSRLYLEYHNPREVWYGSILGFVFTFFAVIVWG